ncbi:TIGR03826 family flagellar region protein [Pseudalkalibacillus sp. Hm43]|uniref:TIGR03826 family flagellar region protein n=1 Tax=Pseudalkalibacillus sp. Hm43 TaxID=3450742 RepID=UPI003F435873
MAELANCAQCGRLFAKVVRSVCDVCYQEEEKMFETVYKFIRKKANREASIIEVSQATGVPEKTIIRFVREGRLRASQFPNLTFPCDSCGKQISTGRTCDDCHNQLKKELETHDRFVQKQQVNERITYYTEK